MRLKDILRSAALFTRTNLLGNAANDSGVFVQRLTLGYVANGTTERKDQTIKLAENWRRIETLVGEALSHQPEDADIDAMIHLTDLHAVIGNIAKRIDEVSLFESHIELDQQDIDQLISNLPYMAMVANHYNRVIREGTTFLGLELDEENDQILIDNIENGPAQFARRHLHEVQMFKFRATSYLTTLASPGINLDEKTLGL